MVSFEVVIREFAIAREPLQINKDGIFSRDRTIQQRLENQLAAEPLACKFTEGDKIKIDANAHKFTFEKIESA